MKIEMKTFAGKQLTLSANNVVTIAPAAIPISQAIALAATTALCTEKKRKLTMSAIDWGKDDPLRDDTPSPRAIPRPELRTLVEKFQQTRRPEGAAANANTSEVITHHFPKREPDALVLVIRRMTCTMCASVSEAQENHLFIRTKSTFSATLQDIELFDHLPRETKVLHLPSPRCGKCF